MEFRRLPRRRRKQPEQVDLPVLTVRETVLFPHMVTPLLVGRDRSVKALEASMATDRAILVIAQRNPEQDEIGPEDIHTIGTEAIVGRVIKLPDGMTSVFIQGQRRVRISEYTQQEPYFRISGEVVEDAAVRSPSTEA